MVERTHILGVGRAVPDNVVTNDDLSKLMDTSDEWVHQRTGIRQRHHIAADCSGTDLGKIAAEEALADAGLGIADIDLIVFATLSPDIDWPASAGLLAAKLGASSIPTFDVRNQCSGFIYSLASADALIRAGRARHALVVGGEIHSTGIDLTTRGRDVAVIFGDGAGAVVLGPSPDGERGLLSTHLHADGKYAEKLWLEGAASRSRPRISLEDLGGEDPVAFPRMQGRYVFKHAVTRFPEVINEALGANGLAIADLDVLIPHQANLRINEFVAAALELEADQVVNNIDRYGNTTAASIPIALHEAVKDARVSEGKLVCMAAFGAGFTWASALLRW
ncbi:MAG: ketoacyl-ACP synthase III [Candidatus Binatia bacterium]|nr:ketoacyl-ACP synthase III [Candidatus Binatia bacterium]